MIVTLETVKASFRLRRSPTGSRSSGQLKYYDSDQPGPANLETCQQMVFNELPDVSRYV
jgi:hypothetical protein